MLSILIVNWNTKDLLLACLSSIQRFAPSVPHEVIVVDNASKDGSAEMVRQEFPSVSLLEPGANTGYAKGNNLAFAVAKGEMLLTLNPDTEFSDGSLQLAVEEFLKHPNHGCHSIKLVSPDGTAQRSVRRLPTLTGVLVDVLGIGSLFSSVSYKFDSFNYNKSGDAPQPMGTFLMFRRKALEAVGDPKKPFDEHFPIFFNEVDLLKRLNDAGWPCRYFAGASVLHYHGASTKKQAKKAMVWESHKSLVRYFWKHQHGIGRLLVPCVALAAYAAAFVRARGYSAGFRP